MIKIHMCVNEFIYSYVNVCMYLGTCHQLLYPQAYVDDMYVCVYFHTCIIYSWHQCDMKQMSHFIWKQMFYANIYYVCTYVRTSVCLFECDHVWKYFQKYDIQDFPWNPKTQKNLSVYSPSNAKATNIHTYLFLF